MLKEFISFFKHPTAQPVAPSSLKEKAVIFLFVFSLDIIIGAISIAMITWLQNGLLKGIEIYKPDPLEIQSLLGDILLTGLLLPFIEELVFRLNLKFKKLYINLSGGVIALCLIIGMLNSNLHKGFILIPVILSLLFVLYNRKVLSGMEAIYKKQFRLVFYGFAILFAALHLTNLNLSLVVLLFSPLLLLSQIGGALTLGFLRLKSGFIWAVASHSIFNIIIVLLDRSFGSV